MNSKAKGLVFLFGGQFFFRPTRNGYSLFARNFSQIIFFCFLIFLSLTGHIFSPAQALGKLQVPYEVVFQGLEDNNLKEELKKVSATVQLIDNPPATTYLLNKRAQGDIPKFLEILKANAYYQASVRIEIQKGAGNGYTVLFQIDTGPLYTLQNLKIIPRTPKPDTLPGFPDAQELGLELGKPALAQTMRSAKRDLLHTLAEQGYIFTQVIKQQVLVDHARQAVDLNIYLTPGPQARLGKLQIQGLERVDEEFVRRKIPWEIGQIYDPALIEDFREKLIKTKLFALVRVEHAQELNAQGRVPLTLYVRERLPRSISAGLGYDTDSGFKAAFGWEHKNLLGKGESLSLDTQISALQQEIEATIRKPSLWYPELSLVGKTSYSQEDTEAYEQIAEQASLSLEYQVSDELSLGTGVGLKRTQVEDLEQDEIFTLASIPNSIQWDTRDDLLDPTQGEIISWQITPYQEIVTGDTNFLKNTLALRWFHNLAQKPYLTLALRAEIGSLWGEETSVIPADERYYAGGGGSIRGYPYQSVGPLKGDDPLGGRSLLEFSSELRWKWTDKWGSVFFLDGGNSYDSRLPDMDKRLFWGCGLGLRYYTGFGPLRMDVAFPLDKRENIDDSFQLYISIGQAF